MMAAFKPTFSISKILIVDSTGLEPIQAESKSAVLTITLRV